MLGKYGITAETASKMFDTLLGDKKSWMESSIENFKLQMHPGEKLDLVQKRVLDCIDSLVAWDRLEGRMVLEDGTEERVVSLYTWNEMVIVDAQTRAFFDEALYEKSSKINIERGLKHYLGLPKERRPNDSWLIRLCVKIWTGLVSKKLKKSMSCSHFIVMNANAYKPIFWIMAHLLLDPDLAEELKQDLHLTNWPMGTRTVQADTIIGGKKLRRVRKLLMPYRAMYFDDTVFGTDAAGFNPKRFMLNKGLVTHKSYRPFGGAAHYSPGHYIVRREMQMFTAVTLMRFDMSLVSQEWIIRFHLVAYKFR
ncbi:cytochrome P450 [Bimuria novae-zelandiae CBS 107.79]|uniref:Cytochrome P450 n=1 Tax=Bimuria novae-zelandiae CBS 107.79 TaxID=1447943 RepID=A0A6A5UUV3_9PLEO|nr:cytochrome P450 [Bimuria novae-zelandiae CBS 107.79]